MRKLSRISRVFIVVMIFYSEKVLGLFHNICKNDDFDFDNFI